VARRDAFVNSMAELGLKVPAGHIVEGDHTMEGAWERSSAWLRMRSCLRPVVCSNDMTAIGVLHGLYRTTHKVPRDISVVGFDDIHLAQFMLPPLTTVQMSCKHLAAAAVQALRAGIEPDHPRATQKEWEIPTRLVVASVVDVPRGTLRRSRRRAPGAEAGSSGDSHSNRQVRPVVKPTG